jgi:integrase/recombinase XerC
MTVLEWQEKQKDFIQYLQAQRNLSTHTIRAYQSDLQQFVNFWLSLNQDEQKLLSCKQIIERYLVSLYYKKINKNSIARKFSCFKSFSKFLQTHGIIIDITYQRPKIDKKLPIYLSVDEIFHLLDQVPDEALASQYPIRDKAIFELLYATGIRCSELIAIRFIDINLVEKTVRIKGKGNTERMALFGEKAKKKITEYITKERVPSADHYEHLFLNYRNQQLTPRSVQRIFEMFRAFLHIKKPITPHKIRHSFATHLLNMGVDLRVVQELLGHKTLTSTEKYTHVSLEDLKTLCETIHPINGMKNNLE